MRRRCCNVVVRGDASLGPQSCRNLRGSTAYMVNSREAVRGQLCDDPDPLPVNLFSWN